MRTTKIMTRMTRFVILVVLRLPTLGSNFATLQAVACSVLLTPDPSWSPAGTELLTTYTLETSSRVNSRAACPRLHPCLSTHLRIASFTENINVIVSYTPYEGPNLANQKSRKLGVFGRKLEGSYSHSFHFFDRY